jgi:hypothetical protein
MRDNASASDIIQSSDCRVWLSPTILLTNVAYVNDPLTGTKCIFIAVFFRERRAPQFYQLFSPNANYCNGNNCQTPQAATPAAAQAPLAATQVPLAGSWLPVPNQAGFFSWVPSAVQSPATATGPVLTQVPSVQAPIPVAQAATPVAQAVTPAATPVAQALVPTVTAVQPVAQPGAVATQVSCFLKLFSLCNRHRENKDLSSTT